MHEFEVQYKEIFDNISVCMFLIDVTPEKRFKIAGFNPAEEKAVGLSNAQVSGKFVEDVLPVDLAGKVTANYRRCLEADAPIRFDDELPLRHERRYFHTNLIPVRDAAGRVYRIIGACIDTTDFKRTQDEALAGQKLESLGVVARGIAHDFNNLLGSILAETELAKSELAAGSVAFQEIETIKEVAIRAAEIVRELMVYSGQDDLDFEPVDVAQLVKEMLQLLSVSISKHALLRIDLPANLPPVLANGAQIRQVVMNLITNASEALGDKEGVISISVTRIRSVDSLRRSAQSLPKGEFLQLTIEDTGCGMTDEIKRRIFDPFFTTKFSGRGLGLAAVQGIVRRHGGVVNVVSTPGRGSRFEVLLPSSQLLVRDSTGSLARALAGGVASGAGTILVVEDEEVLRGATSKMLQKAGFSVIQAADGTSGVDLFRANEQAIDVVLLDMTLPGLSGREVLEEVRRLRPNIQVILTTAYSRDHALTTIGGQHTWHYIRKPYRLHDLTDMIRELLAKPENWRRNPKGLATTDSGG